MGMKHQGNHDGFGRRYVLSAIGLAGIFASGVKPAAAEDDAAARANRWQDLKAVLFANRPMHDGQGMLAIDAPPRALNAAIVPVRLSVGQAAAVPGKLKGLYFVIDQNPSPLAAHFIFGPKADPRTLELRVRVDQYTDMHAVAETDTGELYAVARFIKAAGGCSAPAGSNDVEALKEIGRMKLRLAGAPVPNQPLQATLMIRHPNFNGMQMDQLTRNYTPPRYIQSIEVTYNDALVFHMDTDISLSSDPVLSFGFIPAAEGSMKVTAIDSKNTVFQQSFPVPPQRS